MNLTDRISLLELCNQEFPDGVAVEIGVAGGHFSKQILATWKSIGQIWLIDSWKHFAGSTYLDSCNLSQQTQDERYERILQEFSGDKRVNTFKCASPEAAEDFRDEFFHFIYLDANHSTEAVHADLKAWWPKLKKGGIFAGHDYQPGNGEGYGVKLAVDKFAKEMNLEVHQTTKEFCRPEGIYGAGWEGFSFVLRK